MTDRVRNEPDYSKYVCSSGSDATSQSRPSEPNASGLGPRREYAEGPKLEPTEGSTALAKRAGKASAAVVAARRVSDKLQVETRAETSATVGVSIDQTRASTKVSAGVSVGASASVSIEATDGASITVGRSAGPGVSGSFEVRDKNGDGVQETCVQIEASGWIAGACAPMREPPAVEGAHGASGNDRAREGAGGASGW